MKHIVVVAALLGLLSLPARAQQPAAPDPATPAPSDTPGYKVTTIPQAQGAQASWQANQGPTVPARSVQPLARGRRAKGRQRNVGTALNRDSPTGAQTPPNSQ